MKNKMEKKLNILSKTNLVNSIMETMTTSEVETPAQLSSIILAIGESVEKIYNLGYEKGFQDGKEIKLAENN